MTDMHELIRSYPEFFIKGYNNPYRADSDAENIVYAGMGGSAITGDVLRSYFCAYSEKSFEVVRDYCLPLYAGNDTLLIISSFSGNTEETLSCLEQGMERECRILGIGSGGRTARMIKASGHDFIELPLDVPPRTAMGMSLGAMLSALSVYFDKAFNRQVRSAADKMEKYRFNEKGAEEVAHMLHSKMPVLYSSPSYAPVMRRFANQLSENAKQFAHFNEIPEMNHNEIVGLRHPETVLGNALCLFCKFSDDNERISRRMELTANILAESGIEVMNLEFDSSNKVLGLLNAIMFTDLVSYFCALLNNEDPVAIKRIDALKKGMKA